MTATNENRDWFAIFRTIFGILIIFSIARFFYRGWIYELYVAPSFHFTFRGFRWVHVLQPVYMYLVFSVMAACGLLIAFNRFFRPACIVFFILFTYVELIDVTYYLNHYYLVSLLAFILIFYDARESSLSRYNQRIIFFLKLQVSIVYFFGGINKLEGDWIFRAQPLQIWLHANGHLPLIGKLLSTQMAAFSVAYAAILFDVGVAFLLWFKKTRLIAYIALSLFHIATALLFQIGMFPWIMMTAALLFFHRSLPVKEILSGRIGFISLVPLLMLAICQIIFPLRHFLYPGNYLWTERGFRFAWNIMLIEKDGSIDFGVKKLDGSIEGIDIHQYLTPFQIKMMSTQPDLILQFANHIRDSRRDVSEVYAECHVSLNGRRSKLFFDPGFNLLKTPDEFYQNIRLYTGTR